MSGSPSLSLRELIDIDELQSIQDSFARAVGISSVILSPEGEPLTKFTNPTGFCSLIQSTEKGKERCFRSFMEMGKNALRSKDPEIFYCFAHGGHFVAPIMIDGEHKGTMFAGQFIPEKFSSEQLHDLEEIAHETDIDQGTLVKEAGKMRVVGEDVIRNYSSLLFKIVETIARRGAQAAELSRVNDALQVAHDGLEKRVQERTAELAEANKGLEYEIAERKLAEEALQKESDRAQHYLDVAGVMFLVIGADRKVILINRKGCEILGYEEEEEITGKDWFDNFVPKRLRDDVVRVFNSLIAGEIKPVECYENPVLTKHGEERIVAWHNTLLRDEHGRICATMTSGEDITERKQVEETLRESEEKFRLLAENSIDCIWVVDTKLRFTYLSPSAERILGYKPEQMVGTKLSSHFKKKEFLKVGFLAAKTIKNYETFTHVTFETKMLNSKNDEVDIEISSNVLLNSQGKLIGFQGTTRDITERKHAEGALQESERLLRDAQEVAHIGSYGCDLKSGKGVWSEELYRIFGYSPGEVSPTFEFIRDHIHPDDREMLGNANEALVTRNMPHDVEYRILRKDGGVRAVRSWATLKFDSSGAPARTVGLLQDITERKRAGEQLNVFKAFAETSNQGMGWADIDGNIVYVNSALTELFGEKDQKVPLGKNVAAAYYPEDEQQRIREEIFPCVVKDGAWSGELMIRQTGGKLIPTHNSLFLIRNVASEPIFFANIVTDITERKRMEKALKDRVEFEKIVASISTSFINLALDEVDAGIDDALRSIGEFSGVDRSYLFRLFDDGTKTDNTHEWCARGIVPQIENLKRLQTADFPWFLGRLNRFETVHIPSVADLSPEADAEKEILQSGDIRSAILVPMVYGGTLVGFIGLDSVRQEKSWSEENIALLRIICEIFVNALERKRVMDALRSSETKFHAMFEENPLGAVIVDKERKIRDVNDAAIAMVGRPRKKIIGRTCHEFICPIAENDCPIYDHGLTIDHAEGILLSKDRGEVPIEKTATRITVDGDTMILEMFYDITKRKAAEEAVRESEEKYRNIIENIQDIFYRADMEGNLVMTSRSGAELLGYDSVEGMIGLNISKTFYAVPEERDEFLKALEKKGVVNDYEITLKKTDGTLVPVRMSSHFYFDKSGNPLGVEGLLSDITERKAAETALRESEEKIRMITASANDAIMMVDHKGNISYWNKAAERMFDYTEEEVIGKDLHALLVPERFHAAFLKGFEGFKETGHGAALGKTLELAAFGKDGKEFPVEISLSAVKLKGRWNAIGLIRDTTERKAAEEEIKDKADELERFNKLAVGRELKMIELKKEINALLEESGKEPGYKIVGES